LAKQTGLVGRTTAQNCRPEAARPSLVGVAERRPPGRSDLLVGVRREPSAALEPFAAVLVGASGTLVHAVQVTNDMAVSFMVIAPCE
jgi:hypothetical protein